MWFHKLSVVLWKGFQIRKHHWILTICVVLTPILLFGLLGFARSKVSAIGKQKVETPTYNHIIFNQIYNRIDVSETNLYYAPENKFTEELIRKVQLRLHILNIGLRGFANEEDLLGYYNKYGYNGTTMAVVFNGIKDENIPKNLNYDIRIYEKYVDWETDSLFSSAMQYTPGMGSEKYMEKGFISLQLAIDTSYINMRLGQDKLPVMVGLQEFPYPPHLEDLGLMDMFMHMLPFITLFSFVLTCPATLKRVVEEKASGIKELMKMMGVPSWIIWLGWFIDAILVNTVSIIFIVFFMKWNWGADYPPIEYCDHGVLFLFLWLYCSSCVAQCFTISTFFSKPNFTTIFGILFWIISYLIPFGLGDQLKTLPWIFKMLLCLCPNVAMYFGFTAISIYETRELGANWTNLFQSASGGYNDVTLFNVLAVLLIDTFLYMVATYYFDTLWPGEYGLSKPWYFPFSYISDICKRNVNSKRSIVSPSPTPDNLNYKIEHSNGIADIKIRDMYKYYDSKIAVNGLNIDFYQGEITALLGHNGAGKTTTMSILTGMIAASKGNVYVCDFDIKKYIDQVRSMIGICPQHNLVFPDLTVREQLLFFAKLKGDPKAEQTVKDLLIKLNLYVKRNCFPSKLSGGMKRKLCLGMALVSDPTLLILDEPTSGLDPQARREIWDILLMWRREGKTIGKKRTVIISTHFMEEADVLGDRIAIMDHGNLVCYGTPMYLKKEYNTGYMLTIIKNKKEEEENFGDRDYSDESKLLLGVDEVDGIAYQRLSSTDTTDTATQNKNNKVPDKNINQIIKGILPGATFTCSSGNTIVYNLPNDMKQFFSQILKNLENRKFELNIESMAISITTLEEVFLRAGKLAEGDRPAIVDTTDSKDRQSEDNEPTKCCSCNFKICRTLMKKRLNLFKKSWLFYTLHILVALSIVLITVACGQTNEINITKHRPELALDLSKYGVTQVYFSGQENNANISKIAEFYENLVKTQKGKPIQVPSVSSAIIEAGIKNIANYKQNMVVAAEFNNTPTGIVVNAMYSNPALHGAPISVNLIMNAVLKAFVGSDSSIITTNVPLPAVKDAATAQLMSETRIILLWLMLLPMAPLFIMGCFLLYPNTERVTNIKHMQYMCGVKSYCYWLMSFLFDYMMYGIAIGIFFILFILSTLIMNTPMHSMNEIGTAMLIFLIYGFVAIPFTYLFHYKKTAQSGFSMLLMINLFTGVVLTVIVMVLFMSGDEYWENVGNYVHYISFIFPQYWLTFNLVTFARKAVSNYNFDNMIPIKKNIQCMNDPNPCCENTVFYDAQKCAAYRSYFVEDFSPCHITLYAIFMFILYSIILLAVESYWFQNFLEKCKENLSGYKKSNYTKDKGDIDQNRAFYANTLTKQFANREVVKGVSFKVSKGECFGLLGVNGAGKTTTFRMLTGDELITSGEANINDGTNINQNRAEYLKLLGYCPQFDAINEVLTGRELLALFVDLRQADWSEDGKIKEVNLWITKLGLGEYADVKSGDYSGGNKRKLSLGISMIANRSVIMLDEPTSGVDPISRRKLWNVLSEAKTDDRSIILTSHSMDECESLCDRLAIMKQGKIQCADSVPKLKEQYGNKFSILIKIKCAEDATDTGSTGSASTHLLAAGTQLQHIFAVKSSFMADFTDVQDNVIPELKDEHPTLLHFHLNKTNTLSNLFDKMEIFKSKNETYVEDYSITMATLEDVFLAIANKENDIEPTTASWFRSCLPGSRACPV